MRMKIFKTWGDIDRLESEVNDWICRMGSTINVKDIKTNLVMETHEVGVEIFVMTVLYEETIY